MDPTAVSTRGSTNSSSSSPSMTPNRANEKSPLISSQRRLFRSLSGRNVNHISEDGDAHNLSSPDSGTSLRTLGTFAGVFAPVALSQFSSLLFLRIGYIVGNSGLLEGILQLIIAYGILVFTIFSICAVCTNGAVEGGGAYYVISRTLGPEFGGSIGVLFFVANIFSSTLYITGCVEGIVSNFGPGGSLVDGAIPSGRWWEMGYGSLINVFNLIVCLIGATMFAKTVVIILVVVMICTISVLASYFVPNHIKIAIPAGNHLVQNATHPAFGVFTGLNATTFSSNIYPDYGRDYTNPDGDYTSFATVFGVLFSGITGIMAGANLSGELKDPGKNIPQGTLPAVTFTFVTYLLLFFLTAASCTRFLLQNDYTFMTDIELWEPFVMIGIVTATLSASLSNLIGGSRVLEALARDDIFGFLLRPIVKTIWRGNPIGAVLVSWFCVQLIFFIGSLNEIAQLTSIFFLLSYMAVNFACLGLDMASAPNFRPNFRFFSWHTSLLGMVGTGVMMFFISAIDASVSVIICLLIIIGLHLFSPARQAQWGSISQALIFHQVRKYLLLLDSRKDHVKFWRPQMLLMVTNPRSACRLIEFTNDLKKSGLFVLGHVKVTSLDKKETDPALDEIPHWLNFIDHLKVKAFVELTLASSVREGLHHLIRISGLGAMKPNTILLGFYDSVKPTDFFENTSSLFKMQLECSEDSIFHPRRLRQDRSSEEEEEESPRIALEEYIQMVRDILKLQKNVCLCRHFYRLDRQEIAKSKTVKYVDVWPINVLCPQESQLFDTTSLFLLQLACVLTMVPVWRKHTRLRIFVCVSPAMADTVPLEKQVQETLKVLRIQADMIVVRWETPKTPGLTRSAESDTTTAPYDSLSDISLDYTKTVNEMIKEHSRNTAVTFLYLPQPEVSPSLDSMYLDHLTRLTEDLPPSVLVHGISAVMSTTL